MTTALDIAFIGAGGVNFGGPEGPWDHASRLEQIAGIRLAGVADPDTDKTHQQLSGRSGDMYDNTRIYADYRDMLSELDLDAVWIGVPPNVHGTTQPGKDMEVQCAQAGVPMFVEKPLSAERPETVRRVAEVLDDAGVLTSVGYMFRYSRAVDRMKDILRSVPGGPRVFIATYNCAYSLIQKTSWWDVRSSGGPIVEQATHFVDLARHIVGDADISSLSGVCIGPEDAKSDLSDMPRRDDGTTVEQGVPAEHRIARATAANWQFNDGALGALHHGVLLHGKKYESQIEVWGDGVRLVLYDPYGECYLDVRRPGQEVTERLHFGDDDPYLTEDEAFVEAVRTGDPGTIRSSYADALETFKLTWEITDATS